ncbi:type II secretion system protein N [Comamonas sp. JNW]|uniref:type II secretion system protein N n=1 Tax=Comamonas sp. JNW TaxID=2170731 RepID=UPI000DE6E1DA|nr:type II secretion system protein N [Comamonas sp. JNW]PWB20142.1 general secretion pathway protein C [Comamonas sp. JNW]
MVTLSRNPWSPRLAAGLLWAGAAALAVFWGLKLSAPRQVLSAPQAGGPAQVQVDGAAMARLFGVQDGAPVAAPAAPTRWRLLGVMVGKDSGGGAAVIAVDDQPAKVFRVGTVVADGLVLQALRSDAPRAVSLGAGVDGPAAVTINLPALRPVDAVAAPIPATVPNAQNAPNAVAAAPQGAAPVPAAAPNVDRSTGSLRD